MKAIKYYRKLSQFPNQESTEMKKRRDLRKVLIENLMASLPNVERVVFEAILKEGMVSEEETNLRKSSSDSMPLSVFRSLNSNQIENDARANLVQLMLHNRGTAESNAKISPDDGDVSASMKLAFVQPPKTPGRLTFSR